MRRPEKQINYIVYRQTAFFALIAGENAVFAFLSAGILRISTILHLLGFAPPLLIFACKLQIPLDFDSEIYYNIYVYITIMRGLCLRDGKREEENHNRS